MLLTGTTYCEATHFLIGKRHVLIVDRMERVDRVLLRELHKVLHAKHHLMQTNDTQKR